MSAVFKQTLGVFAATLILFPNISTKATSQPAGIQAVDLGTLGGFTDNAEPAAFNDLGQVTGTSYDAASRRRAFCLEVGSWSRCSRAA